MELLDLIDIKAVNAVAALVLTLAITQGVKVIIERLTSSTASKFAPVIAIPAAAISVAVLIDRGATGQDFWLAVIVVAATAVGGFSGVKNVGEGLKQIAPPDLNAGER